MTIRNRLMLSFTIVLTAFAINLLVYYLANQERNRNLREVLDAFDRLERVGAIAQQIAIKKLYVSRLMVQEQDASFSAEERERFVDDLMTTDSRIAELRSTPTGPAASVNPATEHSNLQNSRLKVEDLIGKFGRLRETWMDIYVNFGVDAIQFAQAGNLRRERERAVESSVGELQAIEKKTLQEATANLNAIENRTNRFSLAFFAASALVAVGMIFRNQSYLRGRINDLKQGTEQIRKAVWLAKDLGEDPAATLGYRVPTQSRDELDDVSHAFNEMAKSVAGARSELTHAHEELKRRHDEVQRRRRESDRLLRSILPNEVAEELCANGSVQPRYYEDVTILFSDFVGFTRSTENLAADELVEILQDYFTSFDCIVDRYGLERLKTIGDSYFCVGGLPIRNPSHPVDTVQAAFEMMEEVHKRDRPDSRVSWKMRIGIHTGPVIAGVIGTQKFAFDIWGETVNFAQRMEAASEPNRINLSPSTYKRVKDFFRCEHRVGVITKENRQTEMYFAQGVLSTLLEDSMEVPPPAFTRRYRTYFQSDPKAFPVFLLEA